MENKEPTAFISHASDDKDRFVLSFSKRLLQNGVDVWIDHWEMLPGDSLIEKIFDEGIKNADVFIIILSRNSVDKPWVREELNAGLVKKISGKCKVIPIVIEDCEIPEALKPIVWERIHDIDNYDEEFDRILASIHEIPQKPDLGTPPEYAKPDSISIPGLSKIDSNVLEVSCEISIEQDHPFINSEKLIEHLEKFDVSPDQMYESLEILDEKYLIEAKRELGSRGIGFFKITTHGFEEYANSAIPDFDEMKHRVLVTLINQDITHNKELSKELGLPLGIINFILDILANRNLIKVIKTMGNNVNVHQITATGKRAARNRD